MNSTRIYLKLLSLTILPLLLLSVILLSIGLAIDDTDFESGHNISRTSQDLAYLDAGPPQAASFSDTVVIVWSEGLENNVSTQTIKARGHIYLKSGNESQGFWRPKIRVQTATLGTGDQPLQNLGKKPQILFNKTDNLTNSFLVHVVWVSGYFSQSAGENYRFPEIRYARCSVADLFNTCQPPTTIAEDTNSATPDFSSPNLTQDDQGNLHVVWTDNADPNNPKLTYSRSYTGGGQLVWSAAQVITAAGTKAVNPQILFANQRLHLVWDDEAGNAIQYIYDDTYDDTLFLKTGPASTQKPPWNTSDGAFGDFKDGDPGFPSITALDGGLAGVPDTKLLFVAFDVLKQGSRSDFTLVYAQSKVNGDDNDGISGNNWTELRGITSNSSLLGNSLEDLYQSSNVNEPAVGLKPRLFITRTNTVTDDQSGFTLNSRAPLTWNNVRLHAVWHNLVEEGGGNSSALQIYHSSGPITQTGQVESWDEPLPVSNPPSLNPRAPNGPDDRDSAAPVVVISDPNTGGLGKAHAVFVEREGDNPNIPWDAYYRGIIRGTIDPDYIKDPQVFVMTSVVTPADVATSSNTIAPITLDYQIDIINKGELDVIGVSITNTLSNKIDRDSITFSTHPSTGFQGDFDNGRFMWTGNIPAGSAVRFTFTAVTTPNIKINSYVINSVDLWNKYLGPQPLISSQAETWIHQWQIYLPVVLK
ncbi:MAG: hypothetical protein B6I38_05925 [Anaerolineaceae bacterium 4572_5.1]|nr:MAG: hypothetical protein B6I38_05925 [Anaerolineaceae bacterium 4572_5.1]